MLKDGTLAHVQQCSVLSVEIEMYANHNDKSGEGERMDMASLAWTSVFGIE